ncbi:GAF domain-containing protein [Modestobacter italicus]|uniref:GAF domain-containing protein n=1 Tax=Modestobacter italicus (strain DSM 44449 / CECT 9708 / BC 501) TaxID=2732864 RepID=UPI001C94DC36|nr:GAF domain-containing protein [Modestobacter italicus]
MTTAYELPTWAALPARADEGFDQLARTVADRLRVPRALVVLVSKGGQVFPGAHGVAEPWATRRSMPLSNSMSQRVAATGSPLVLRDARQDPEFGDGPAVRELGVIAYAGMPLWDVRGRPTGVLCALDTAPRDWTGPELAVLRGLADEGSRQLQVRAVELAEREARAAALRDAAAARVAADSARAAFVEAEAEADRTRLVARLGEALLTVETVSELLRCVDRDLRSPLGATAALLGTADGDCPDVRVWAVTPGSPPSPVQVAVHQLSDPHPLTVAMRERRLVPVGTPEEGSSLSGLPAGTETALAVPLLLGQQSSEAGLLVAWAQRRELDPALLAVAGDLGRHVGHALDRVLLRQQRLRLGAVPPARDSA